MESRSNSLSKRRNVRPGLARSKLKRRRISSLSPKINESLQSLLLGQEDDIHKEPSALPSKSLEESDKSTALSSKSPEELDKSTAQLGTSFERKSQLNTQHGTSLTEAHAKRVFITVLLENANLETVKQDSRKRGVTLLNCDDHAHMLKKSGREANDARPDIVHQCLLMLLDSPLNKAGRLKVYIRTANNVLIDVHPHVRIPRTIKRFSGLMSELLEKFKVRGSVGFSPLLKVIKNPITSHLPVGAHKVVCTYNTDNVLDIREHASKIVQHALPRSNGVASPTEEDIADRGQDVHVVYVVGAMAHGKVTEEWADEYVCISEYPLSGATVCSKITNTYESLLDIL